MKNQRDEVLKLNADRLMPAALVDIDASQFLGHQVGLPLTYEAESIKSEKAAVPSSG